MFIVLYKFAANREQRPYPANRTRAERDATQASIREKFIATRDFNYNDKDGIEAWAIATNNVMIALNMPGHWRTFPPADE